MNTSGWSQGYVTDTTYTERFFRELSPAWLNYAVALNGVLPRDLSRPFTYLELGCGFGVSAIVNAGAFPRGEFHACDFNPAHIDGGRRQAAAFGIGNIQFHESSFQQLLAIDLPPFDFIVLHGVYSWVSAEARQAIRRTIHEKLKPGGLVYLSYNCLPGWAVEAPVRRLLLELVVSESGDTAQRAEQALGELQRLIAGNPRYFSANPAAAAAVESYRKGPDNYLVHEFLNQTWEPFYSIDIANEMAEAEAIYAGSATLADNHEALTVPEQAAAAAGKLKTARQRQLAIDFAVNRRFRRDVFVRGAASNDPREAARYLGEAVIGCLGNPDRIGGKVQVPRGAITFQEDFISDLRGLMQRGSMTIKDATGALSGRGRNPAEIVRNLTFLVAAGVLMPFAQVRQSTPAARTRRPVNETVERVLTHILEQRTLGVLPSEVAGNGVPVSPVEALAITEALAGAGSGKNPTVRNVIEDLLPAMVRLGMVL
jgi:SAM-dependent methyltransferase